MSLLENDNKKPTMKLRINKDFAKKFEHKKKREHLENAKKKLGSSTFKSTI